MNNLRVLQISDNIGEIQEKILDIYEKNNLNEDKDKLIESLKRIESDEDIIMTFIGQYSAGKSTIISALTGNRDIKIDADVATEVSTRYKWDNQITLVDSPGLYTENEHHDLETEKAIESSNMLIYCITNELFDEITIKDYKKWTYELGYKDKMFLVINKMSRETGEYEDLIKNYEESMEKALEPYSLKDIKYNFIDAQDYIEGKDLDFTELIDMSKFDEFIVNLNEFAEEKGILSKLDTPIKAIISSIDLVLSISLEKESDKNLMSLFDRIYKRTDKAIKEVKQEARNIVKLNLNPFISYGYDLAQMIGNEEFDFNEIEIEQRLENTCININNEINELLESKNNVLEDDIEKVLNSELGNVYIDNISKESNIKNIDLTDKNNSNNFSKIMDFTNKSNGSKIFQNKGFSFATTSSKVSGSALHQGVKTIGGKVGMKFKPWQAVNIAKNLGKAISVVGIGLDILGTLSDIKKSEKEEQHEKDILKAKFELRENFMEIARDLEEEYDIQIKEVVKEYEETLEQINIEKENMLKNIDESNELNKNLEEEKEKLKQIQEKIFINDMK